MVEVSPLLYQELGHAALTLFGVHNTSAISPKKDANLFFVTTLLLNKKRGIGCNAIFDDAKPGAIRLSSQPASGENPGGTQQMKSQSGNKTLAGFFDTYYFFPVA